MDLRLLATVFTTVFIAELGDKTQLATMLYAADARNPKLTILLGASGALILSSALGVLAGSLISRYVSPRAMSWAAGLGFIGIGIWTILRAQGGTS
jgi:putative Ca2+/H+ antiporter (TMEM165/GDT1 family)